jgi:phosphatidylglycerol---prolipoprotein diacylglyceryl transferase
MVDYIIHWNFDPTFFSVGPLQLRWYGLIWAAAFLLGQQFVSVIYRREGRENRESDYLFIAALFGTIIGARLAHCLIYEPAFYLAHPIAILKVWEGGLASHGGAVGMLLALWFCARRFSVPSYLWLLDRVAIPAALGAALVRLANFLGSEIVGRPTSGTWGVIFDAVDQVPRHPVQLYEASAYLIMFALLLVIYLRRGARTPHGLLSGIFLAGVFTARFILEFFKAPQAAYEANFAITVGQWLSVPFVLGGLYLWWYSIRATRSGPTAAGDEQAR